jgi:hypothetical protein
MNSLFETPYVVPSHSGRHTGLPLLVVKRNGKRISLCVVSTLQGKG